MSSLPTSAESVVFDCDGLLVNTGVCWSIAEAALFAAHGHRFGPEQKALVIGRTVEEAGAARADHFGRPGAGAELAPVAGQQQSPGTARHGTGIGRPRRLLHPPVRRRRDAFPQARTLLTSATLGFGTFFFMAFLKRFFMKCGRAPRG
jgi:hypothetical protein